MGLIVTLIIGGIIGWLASLVMKTNAQMGMVANVLVGIVGAWIGSYLGLMLGVTGAAFGGYLMSVIGAMVLIFVLKALGLFK